MRKINNIVLHCTATATNATIEAIKKYWAEVLKWKSPGYHYIIDYAGTVHSIHPEELISNGVSGHNHDSINISYIGGVVGTKAVDTRSDAQKQAMITLLLGLRHKYPGAKICGHRDFPGVKKACPSFDVAKWLKEVNNPALL